VRVARNKPLFLLISDKSSLYMESTNPDRAVGW
jgi:hypothetical protein